MKKTLLVVVIMALIIGLCAAAVSAKSDDGQGLGQALSLQQVGIARSFLMLKVTGRHGQSIKHRPEAFFRAMVMALSVPKT